MTISARILWVTVVLHLVVAVSQAGTNPDQTNGAGLEQLAGNTYMPAEQLTEIGSSLWKNARAIEVSGNYAYCATGTGLMILDVSNPASPTEVSKLSLPLFSRDIAISGSYAYVISSYDLVVVDISNVTAPVLTGHLETLYYGQRIEVSGAFAYVADEEDGLKIINVSNPYNPHEVASYPTVGDAKAVAVDPPYLYLGDNSGRLIVLNISTPSSPSYVGEVPDVPGYVYSVTVVGDLAYVGVSPAGLVVYDVSSPGTPNLIGSLPLDRRPLDIFVSGNSATMHCSDFGLVQASVADPSEMFVTGSREIQGSLNGIDVVGQYAYVASAQRVGVFNLAGVPAISETGSWNTSSDVSDVTLSGGLAYVAIGADGVRILGLPGGALQGFYATPGSAEEIVVTGDYAFVACGSGGLQVLDVSEPYSISPAGLLAGLGSAGAVAVQGDYAYVGDGTESNMTIFDITDPLLPIERGHVDLPDTLVQIAVSGNLVVGYTGSRELYVIDISTVTSPSLAASHALGNWPYGIVVESDYAYLANSAGVQIVDLSAPTVPDSVGTYPFGFGATAIALSGDTLYVTSDSTIMALLDISNPASPSLLSTVNPHTYSHTLDAGGPFICVAGEMPWPSTGSIVRMFSQSGVSDIGGLDMDGTVDDVDVFGDYAYVAERYRGLDIVDISDSADPNPMSYLELSGETSDVAYADIAGGYVCLARGGDGLLMVDVSNPFAPSAVGEFDTAGTIYSVEVVGSTAYATGAWTGLQIVDLSNPSSLHLIGAYGLVGLSGYTLNDVTVNGNYAYLSQGGVRIVDISNPAVPVARGYDTTYGGSTKGITYTSRFGGYVFLTGGPSGYNGVQVYDVSDPLNPFHVYTYVTEGYAEDVAVDGTLLYVADGSRGVLVLDITNPALPTLAGSHDTPGVTYDIRVRNGLVYTADRFAFKIYGMQEEPPVSCCVGHVGDINGEGGDEPTIGDIAVLVDALYITLDWSPIRCLLEADVNQSGGTNPVSGDGGDITIGDVSLLVDRLFIANDWTLLPDCL